MESDYHGHYTDTLSIKNERKSSKSEDTSNVSVVLVGFHTKYNTSMTVANLRGSSSRLTAFQRNFL